MVTLAASARLNDSGTAVVGEASRRTLSKLGCPPIDDDSSAETGQVQVSGLIPFSLALIPFARLPV